MMEIASGIEGRCTVDEDEETFRGLVIVQPKSGDNERFEENDYHSTGPAFFGKSGILSLGVNFPIINIRGIISKNPVGFFN